MGTLLLGSCCSVESCSVESCLEESVEFDVEESHLDGLAVDHYIAQRWKVIVPAVASDVVAL